MDNNTLKGKAYLEMKLALKKGRILPRYKYYEMKYSVPDFGISTPPTMRQQMSVIGWCGRAVDALADRLIFREFREDNFDMNGIFDQNNRDVLLDSAMLSALISSCCFIYISDDEEGFPRLQVIDGAHATGIIDPITNLLTEGYAILEEDENKNPEIEAYFRPDATEIYVRGKLESVYEHKAEHPLLVPIIYRPDAVRPFGHSRISRACMSYVDGAVRTLKRSEISAEFYSYPQKYVTGLSQDAEPMEKWKAAMSSMLAFTKDDDGERPTVGQFQSGSMSPHIDQLRMFASMFAGETGLTLDDLGFPSENPSSAEAIKSAHENLRLTAAKAQRTFGTGLLNTGYLAACVRDNYPYRRSLIYKTTPIWEPVFMPDASALSVIGDGANKINQVIPGYFTSENLRDLTGIKSGE